MSNEQTREVRPKLFAKLSGKRGAHLLVFSDSRHMERAEIASFDVPLIAHEIEFEPGRRGLEHDEWFSIALTPERVSEMISPYTRNALNNVSNTTIQAEHYSKVIALYKTDGKYLLISKVTSGLKVASKTFIKFNDHPEIETYTTAIEFTGQVDAYFDGESKLYFRSYATINALFKGIEDFYRRAGAAELSNFIDKPFFKLGSLSIDQISIRDSRRIAVILDDERIKLDDDEFQHQVLQYARKFVPAIINGGKLKIDNKDMLHDVFSALQGRYYTDELYGEKREALEVKSLNNETVTE